MSLRQKPTEHPIQPKWSLMSVSGAGGDESDMMRAQNWDFTDAVRPLEAELC